MIGRSDCIQPSIIHMPSKRHAFFNAFYKEHIMVYIAFPFFHTDQSLINIDPLTFQNISIMIFKIPIKNFDFKTWAFFRVWNFHFIFMWFEFFFY